MEELRKFREVNHLTQDQLGEYLGIKKSFISRVENGQVGLPTDKFNKLIANERGWDITPLKVFQVQPRTLFRITNWEEQPETKSFSFVREDPRETPAITLPRTGRELKNEKLVNENLAQKRRIEELEKRIQELEKQNQEYWDMLKQLIVVIDR